MTCGKRGSSRLMWPHPQFPPDSQRELNKSRHGRVSATGNHGLSLLGVAVQFNYRGAKTNCMGGPLGPSTLVGRHVRLEPLGHAHAERMLETGTGVDWSMMPSTLTTPGSVEAFISDALSLQGRGEAYPFAALSGRDGRAWEHSIPRCQGATQWRGDRLDMVLS